MTTRIITALIAAALIVAALLTGCQTNAQMACDGHGGLRAGYANGWVRCNDGTWQKATG